MAVELTQKIDLKIITEEKTSVFPVTVYLQLDPQKRQKLEEYEARIEAESREFDDSAKQGRKLLADIEQIKEKIDDINDELGDDLDKDERRDLITSRKQLRKKLRKAERALEKHNEQYDKYILKRKLNEMIESAAREGFNINIKADEHRDALENAMEKYGIKATVIMEEVNRLIDIARKKKKNRS